MSQIESSHGPMFRELASDLKSQILNRKHQKGDRLPTIRQLVETSNYSLSTVHKALGLLEEEGLIEGRRGSGFYIKYEPSESNQRRRFKILVLMPHFVSADEFWFTGKIVEGMTYAAQEKQINLSFERIPEEVYQKKPDGSSLLLDIIRSNSPQGIIWLHPGDHSEHISRIRKLGVEVITSMRQMSETDVPVVRDDDYAFSSQVLSALKSLGHRSVGIFVSSSENDEYYDTRVQALLDTAESLAMEVPVVIPIAEEEDPALQLKIAKNLLSTYNNLTAYVDMFAYGTRYFIRAMEEIPNEVPKDLALVYNVLDGIDIPKLPPQWGELSTITPPLFKIGEQLVSWLLARITNDGSYRPKRLVPVLEIRSSMKQKMS